MNIDQVKIGNFIVKLRKTNNLTQEQLAEKLNISRQAVGYWETGKEIPNNINLEKLSNIFNVSKEEILNGELNNKKTKFNKKIIISLLIILILIPIILFSLNQSTTYVISGQNENIAISNGILSIKSDEIYFYLGSIENGNEEDIKSLEIYKLNNNVKEKIYECKNCKELNIILFDKKKENLYFDIKNIKKDIKNLFVDFILEDGSIKKVKLNFIKNNKHYFAKVESDNEINNTIDNNVLVEKIIKKFKKSDDGLYFKYEKYEMNYLNNTLMIDVNNDKLETYTYNIPADYLSYELYEENNLVDNQNIKISENPNNKTVIKFFEIVQKEILD